MNINMNVINMENINQMPKLQTQLYISPLEKLNLKKINYNFIRYLSDGSCEDWDLNELIFD